MLEKVVHKWLRVPHVLHVGNDIAPRTPEATVVFIHGLGNSHKMWRNIVKHVANDHVRVISVDLLGFGSSPKPDWQSYSALVQAQSLKLTLRTLLVRGPVILVGHSLGSLVAVQYGTLYPKHVQSLLLCSPPFYRPPKGKTRGVTIPQSEDIRRRMFSYSRNNQELASKLVLTIKKARLLDDSFRVDDETMPAIVSSMEMSIENQTALTDAENLKLPIHIIYGKLDPFIVKGNIRRLESKSSNITLETIIAGHEVGTSKQYIATVTRSVKALIDAPIE